MDDWTWKETVACWLHDLAYKFSPPQEHCLLVRDEHGAEIISIAFEGGFVAVGPPERYTLHCRHYENDADFEGTVEDL